MFLSMKSHFVSHLFGKKSVATVSTVSEQTREGINKSYVPKFFYAPPFGYPRIANLSYVRHLAKTPYVEMCISTIIDEIKSIEWDIVPEDGMEDQADESEIEHIKNFYMNPNTNDEDFNEVFVEMPVRDMLEVNTGIWNKIYNLKLEMVEVVARDGATFTVNPDIHGMFTNRADILIPHNIVPDNAHAQHLNPFNDIKESRVRNEAAYFQYGWLAGPMPVPFGKREIVFLEKMKRTDDHYGYSPVQVLEKSLQMLIYMIESDLDYFNQNNVPKGIIGLDGSDIDEIEAFKEQWYENQRTRDEFGNMKKMMHKVPITNRTPNFTRIEFSASEMQLIEKQKWYTKMVWACFGCTATELGYTEDSMGSANQIVQSKVFRKKGINPVLRKLESGHNHGIIPEFGYVGFFKTKSGKKIEKQKYKFVYKKFDVDEEKQKYELYKMQTESGLKTINEIRIAEGLEEVAWGNEPPKNWMASQNSINFMDGSSPKKNDPNNPKDIPDKEPQPRQDPGNDKRNSQNSDQKSFQEDLKYIKQTLGSYKFPEGKANSIDPDSNPLLMNENERPISDKRLADAIKYVLASNEKKIIALLEDQYGDDVIKKIRQKMVKSHESKGFKDFIQRIKEILSVFSLGNIIKEIIKNNYLDGFEKAETHVNKNLNPDMNAIAFISDYTFELVKDINNDMADRLSGIFTRAFMEGTSITQVKTQIMDAFDIGENRAEMISRTETNRAANFGRLHGYQQSGEKIVKTYITTNDDRRSKLCGRMDGQERDLNENFEDPNGEWEGMVPPAHPNCRSTWTARILED